MPQTFYDVVWIFIIYAFIGWCTEVSYAALDAGIFVNRGFLNGPYCPIYGCGVLTIIVALTPLKSNLLILFAGSFLLTSILEYITGYILEKVFHNKWWDYSDKPFNIRGYVCLKFSIFWGLACSFIMLVLHPIIFRFIRMIPKTLGIVLLVIIMTAFVVDCIVTVTTILKFNKRLKVMDEVAGKLKVISNEIGENIYENVSEAIEKKEDFEESHEELISDLTQKKNKLTENVENSYQKLNTSVQKTLGQKKAEYGEKLEQKKAEYEEKLEQKRAEYEELSRKYKELASRKSYGQERLMKAFPKMKSADHNEALNSVKEHVKKFLTEKEGQEQKK